MIDRNRSRIRGFTLIELVVVMAIMGIISVVAVPKYLSIQDNARETACQQSMNMIIHELELKYAQDGVVPSGSLSDLGITDTCPGGGKYTISSIKETNGELKIVLHCTKHGDSEPEESKNFISESNSVNSNIISLLSKLKTKYGLKTDYIDSTLKLSDEDKEQLKSVFNIDNDNIIYWNVGNANRVCWTTADVNLKQDGTYYVPVYSYGYLSNDYGGVYSVYMSQIDVATDNNGVKKVTFKRLSSETEITNESPKEKEESKQELENKTRFEYVSDFYNKAIEELKNYTIKSETDAKAFAKHVNELMKKQTTNTN